MLHPDQTAPGALLLTALRHVPRISDLTTEESAEWFLLFRAVEASLEELYGAALVVVLCERNWAYRTDTPEPPFKDGKPNPHVHWHVAPRYRDPVRVGDAEFEDLEFGVTLIWRGRRVDAETRTILMNGIFERLAAQPGVVVDT